jgi:hypothetical protein
MSSLLPLTDSLPNGTLAANSCPTLHGTLLTPYWIVLLSLVVVSIGGGLWNIVSERCWDRARKQLTPNLQLPLLSRADVEIADSTWIASQPLLQRLHIGRIVQSQISESGRSFYVAVHETERGSRVSFLLESSFRLLASEDLRHIASKRLEKQQTILASVGTTWRAQKMKNDAANPLPEDCSWYILTHASGNIPAAADKIVGDLFLLTADDHDVSEAMSEQTPLWFVSSPSYCIFMFVLQLAHFLYMLQTLDPAYVSSAPQADYTSHYAADGADAAWSPLNTDGHPVHEYGAAWLRYEQFYVRLVNSGWLTLWISTFLSRSQRKASHVVSQLLGFIGVTSMVALLPIALTHAVSACAVFPFLLPATCLLFWMLHSCRHYLQAKHGKHWWAQDAVWMLFCMFPLMLMLQTAVHYAMLLYASDRLDGDAWTRVVVTEWNLRSTRCYVESLQQQTRHVLAFLSYL